MGRLLLLTEPIVFNGTKLEVTEEPLTGGQTKPGAGAPFVPRAAGSRPRAGLGSKKTGIGAAKPQPQSQTQTGGTGSGSAPAAAGGKSQADFRNMLLSGKK